MIGNRDTVPEFWEASVATEEALCTHSARDWRIILLGQSGAGRDSNAYCPADLFRLRDVAGNAPMIFRRACCPAGGQTILGKRNNNE